MFVARLKPLKQSTSSGMPIVYQRITGRMARNPQVQSRVEPDTMDSISDYQEDNGDLSNSEATRRLIRRGLAEEGYNVAAPDGGTVRADLKRLENRQEQILDEMSTEGRVSLAGRVMLTLDLVFIAASVLFAPSATLGLAWPTVGGLLLILTFAVPSIARRVGL